MRYKIDYLSELTQNCTSITIMINIFMRIKNISFLEFLLFLKEKIAINNEFTYLSNKYLCAQKLIIK